MSGIFPRFAGFLLAGLAVYLEFAQENLGERLFLFFVLMPNGSYNTRNG